MVNFLKIIEGIGDKGEFLLPTLGIGYALGNKHQTEAKLALASLALQQIALRLIKDLTKVPRPNNSIRLDSLPSGHTTGAFFGLTFFLIVTRNEKDITLFKATSLVLAVLTGISRYTSKNHWPTDIFAGAILGSFFGAAAATRCFTHLPSSTNG